MDPYRNPALTVDAIVEMDGKLLLVRRGREPFAGMWALPGGFVEYGETVEDAVRRELLEETSLTAGDMVLFGVYSDPDRDPRGHTVSVVFRVKAKGEIRSGDDAAEAALFPIDALPPLAFDHADMINDYRTQDHSSRV